jgi:hypothetical protein
MVALCRSIVALVALVAAPWCVAAQQAPVRIAGTVKSAHEDKPLQGVDIELVGTSTRVQTGADGTFDLAGLEAGKHVVEARLVGFRPVQATVTLAPGQSALIGFSLAPLATPLPEVTVTADEDVSGQMAEFYQRRSEGHGYFITRQDLERLHPLRLSDALYEVPGVRVECKDYRCVLNMARVQPSLIGDRVCHVQYFVDGVRYGMPGEEVNIDEFRPNDIEGIEIYRGQAGVPARYTGRDVRCGVVLLWIRIGRRH